MWCRWVSKSIGNVWDGSKMIGQCRRTIIGSGKTKCGESNGMLGLEMAYILGEIIGWSRNENGMRQERVRSSRGRCQKMRASEQGWVPSRRIRESGSKWVKKRNSKMAGPNMGPTGRIETLGEQTDSMGVCSGSKCMGLCRENVSVKEKKMGCIGNTWEKIGEISAESDGIEVRIVARDAQSFVPPGCTAHPVAAQVLGTNRVAPI